MKRKNMNKKLIAGAFLAMVTVSASALELNVKKPARAVPKPDLIVYLVDRTGPDTYRITIKNIGQATSGSAVLTGKDMASGGGYGEATIPSLAANGVTNRDVKLSKAPRPGNRVQFVADAKKHVDESNERNNTKYVNY